MSKKIIRLLLSASIMMIGLTGCGGTEEEDKLRVGVDLKFPPFSYVDEEGEPAGFEVEIAEAFGEFIGQEVEIVNTDFSLLLPALETGDVDILIADMARTDERAKKADFSIPYRYTYTLALVNKEFAEANGVDEKMTEEEFFALPDAQFIGLAGTKGVYYPQSKGVEVTEVTEIGTGLIEISKGQSDVLIASNEVFSFQAADPENTIVYAGIKNQDGSNFAVRLGDTEMLAKANEFIESMYAEGGLYEQMAEKYDPIIAEFLQNDEVGLDFITEPVK
ncbi:MAG: hypothetical protein ATN31_02315 [Candidatus Epulonipiscioides saccharophilum]|nr:MAG: hypothetical protein ATN31_02315 [Epulopiscium sp. AS2M-Bin001]